jgi:methylamine dehydrogenase accessory protein MauD
MTTIWLVAFVLLWGLVLLLGFLLLGVLRAQGLLAWRLDQLEATMPSHIGRSGLAPGKQAPEFQLQCVQGGEVSLADFTGRKVLLVFVQSGCGPCREIVPELNRLRRQRDDLTVLGINHATPQEAKRWAAEARADFPVLVQEDWSVSKRYEAFATPFAFLINERGVITSKGLVSQCHYLGYILSPAVRLALQPAKGPFASPTQDEPLTVPADTSR